MSAADQVRKLEALLDRVRRNKMSAPARAAAASEAIALDALPPQTTPMASVPAAPITVQPVAAPPPVAPPPVAAALEPLPVTPPAPPVSPAPPTVESVPPAAAFQPEPGSAVQHRPLTEPPMEISDDDLVEVTTIPPEAEVSGTVEVSVAVRSEPPRDDAPDIDAIETDDLEPLPPSERESVESRELLEDDQAPASSSRFKVPSTLDEALASAAESEGEREIPVLTPPPESGPQEALPATGLDSPRIPDMQQLEADLEGPPSLGPTAEQLGETIELEAPRGPELEIDVAAHAESAPEPEAVEELEVTLPRASLPSGLYDVNVAVPPVEPIAPAPIPEVMPVPAQASSPDEPTRTVSRPAIGATDVARVTLVPQSSPKSFVELLDASLDL